ncbi:MAG: hypothetical protein COU42_02690 [Candidatus Nealsonbacteria bacterium CG10_big_fil_rev_8_21_14_0_10_36_24]|uniref:Galactose oxidase n=2 Tax=Candidatus Nealsoniibacteriota TaxID=1817911 RepID=A0A2H0YP59_9BACT|nr:MAG: hypothetical protein COU42_02690 [Candidatus Nealsonbacteria bacterium CG10_big_fil_rev_8_21_14_0_10_36_24]PIS40284.1 MAG: hypothetical protein COT32_00590 [Candidatus Nealsonbacteria bacterium CG08_land_8_20_14_0_20_36_22]
MLKKLLLLFFIGEVVISGFFIFKEIKKIEAISEITWFWQKTKIPEKVLPFEPDNLGWEEATASALWTKRDAHTALFFDDKILIMGGIEDGDPELAYEYHGHKSDVWSSEEGREDHTCVVLKDKIWVMGGMITKGRRVNDVWYSAELSLKKHLYLLNS